MLRGRFGESSGRPYFTARVYIPNFEVAGNVSFIFDTGADRSVLMPADAITLGVKYNLLTIPFQSFGIGGTVQTYLEQVRLAFLDDNEQRVYGYDIQMLIHPPTENAMRVPSLLGRDIIDRWRVTYDKSTRVLFAEVVSKDTEYMVLSQ